VSGVTPPPYLPSGTASGRWWRSRHRGAAAERFAEEAAGTQDPAPDERYRAGGDPSRLLSLRTGNGSFCPNPSFVGRAFRLGSNYGSLTHGTSVVPNNVKSARYSDLPYVVDMMESISQIRDRSAAPRAAQVIRRVR
jgi:hypothetical protein